MALLGTPVLIKAASPQKAGPTLRVPGEGPGLLPEGPGGETGRRCRASYWRLSPEGGPRPRAWLGSWPAACGWSLAPVGAALSGVGPLPRRAGRVSGQGGRWGTTGAGVPSPGEPSVATTINMFVQGEPAREPRAPAGGKRRPPCRHTGPIVRAHAMAAPGRPARSDAPGPVGSASLGPLAHSQLSAGPSASPLGPGTEEGARQPGRGGREVKAGRPA